MQEVILALIAGLVVGLIFAFLKLPLPAPPVLSGIMGIVGVYMGGMLYQQYIAPLFS
ncbi:XapX domain-containing protein [Psychromonas aquatilis]|uniref:XapX domain-containing protein n=1 Tax=Psychromonas aquatilis TaxID=2005072 RepID=A0ABU9GQQ2_9GAMM